MKLIKNILLLVQIWGISITASSQETKLKITIDGQTELIATLVDNSSTAALIELLKDNPLTISMHDYGNMEKVGPIGTSLPKNDEQITTGPGDLILYQGNALVIYYAPNSWNFTRLGKIDNVSQQELKNILGDGDVNVMLEFADTTTSNMHLKDSEDLFRVYPNPTKENFKISGEFEAITLLDMNGKKVFSTKENKVNLRGYPSGIYIIRIKSRNNKTTLKTIFKG